MTELLCDGKTGADLRARVRRRLKICIALRARFLAGGEVAAERLALGLQAMGHEVFFLVGNQEEVLERFRGSGLRCIVSRFELSDKWHWWRYLKARKAMRTILQRERPDLVHSNDFPSHQIVSDALRGTGIPEICHHRSFWSGPGSKWLNKYGCEHHLFVSRALMMEMTAQWAESRECRCAVVYDGLPLPVRPEPVLREDARRRLGLPLDRVLVTFAGQVIDVKGVADLLRAWAGLPGGVSARAELLIVGDDLRSGGTYRNEMEKLARELRAPARFVGFQKDVNSWLLASDISVVPSHVEPLGNATLEAMSFALPVIGTTVGGIPEMIGHEQTGLLVPPHSPQQLSEALGRLLTDERLRRAYGVAGRERCEQVFSLEAHTNNVLHQYAQCLGTTLQALTI